jgi:hypothetical protein
MGESYMLVWTDAQFIFGELLALTSIQKMNFIKSARVLRSMMLCFLG